MLKSLDEFIGVWVPVWIWHFADLEEVRRRTQGSWVMQPNGCKRENWGKVALLEKNAGSKDGNNPLSIKPS